MLTRMLTVLLGFLAVVFITALIFNHVSAWMAVIFLILVLFFTAKKIDSKLKN